MRDFFVSVWRSAVRERGYVALNLLGLAIGFACSVLLGLFLHGELTFDRHFDDHQRIFRVIADTTRGDQQRTLAQMPRAASPLLAADHPEIEQFVRFTTANLGDGLRLRHDDLVLSWEDVYFATDTVFRVFSHRVLAGDPATALAAPSSVAVSTRLARAYFGDADPIGRMLSTDAGADWKITLVFDDLPANTHLRYDALFADKMPLLQDAATTAGLREQLTRSFGANTYVLMRPGFRAADWDRINDQFVGRHLQATMPPGMSVRTRLQALADIHYGQAIDGDLPAGNPAYLYGSLAIALLILAVACINYANLATARALRQARSVAIRKILGARRGTLIATTLGEAVLYASISAVLGLALAEVAVSFTPVGELLGDAVRFDLSSDGRLFGAVLLAAVLIGLIAGVWPAVYLSAWMPLAAFSRGAGESAHGSRLREWLVALQFMIAACVVAATIVMGSQMRHIATTSLGFERENRVMVTVRGTNSHARLPALAQRLQSHPQVLGVAQTSRPPGRYGRTQLWIEDANAKPVPLDGANVEADPGFLEAMRIPLVAGRNLEAGATQQGRQFLVNQALVRQAGWQNPVGQAILGGRVVGVVQDFHFSSLRDPIRPLVISLVNDDPGRIPEAQRPFWPRTLMIRISGRDFAGTIRHIENAFAEFDPGKPLDYTLLDESLRDLYAAENRALSLIALFATLCVLIACLGLYGLTAFATERRAREIAIRKVLGASRWQVVTLLARRITVLIALGGLVATLVVWVLMDQWLAGFASRTSLNPLLLGLAVVLVATVAIATVVAQSARMTQADPAEALHGE